MAEATNADARGNEENGTDRALRDPAAGRSVGGRLLEERLTRESLRIFYLVYNRLGYGKLESVYRNAMVIEFRESGLDVAAERPIDVWYDGQVVGTFRADIVVEGRVVLELKAGRKLDESAHAQLLNYLSCSDIEVGLLLHFGPTPRFRRAVHSINRERLPYPR